MVGYVSNEWLEVHVGFIGVTFHVVSEGNYSDRYTLLHGRLSACVFTLLIYVIICGSYVFVGVFLIFVLVRLL